MAEPITRRNRHRAPGESNQDALARLAGERDAARRDAMTVDRDVTGYCPMGCGPSLFLGEGGRVTCRDVECPEPSAVDILLGDRETEHIVEFFAARVTIRHPLRERLGAELMDCALHVHVTQLDGPPAAPGRYRARRAGTRWTWERLEDRAPRDEPEQAVTSVPVYPSPSVMRGRAIELEAEAQRLRREADELSAAPATGGGA